MKEIITILIGCSLLTAFAVPVLLVVKLFKNGTDEFPSWLVIIKAALGFLLWAFFSLWSGVLWLVIAAGDYEEMASNSPRVFITSCVMGVIYMIAGCSVVYWVWRQEKLELP